MSAKNFLTPGVPAPWFTVESTANPRFHFDTVAGRYVVLFFFGTASHPTCREALDGFIRQRAVFDDANACFFGVSNDPEDRVLARVWEMLPGVRYFWDFDRAISRQYGAVAKDSDHLLPHTVILDPRLRVVKVIPLDGTPGHAEQVVACLEQLPPFSPEAFATVQAPVLVVPRIFEPELCQKLMSYYNQHGGAESGFMREIEGKTVPVSDHGFKRRRDQEIEDEGLRKACMFRIHDRLMPEIFKAFQFKVTRIERYIVACYEANSGGFFRAHRDNTTKGTAHRKFAVSLNLNTGDYAGGCLRFPEFGPQWYVPPAGGAVVFSCSLLHEATPVTAGKRYAFLPFLYDEEGARVREQNLSHVAVKPPQQTNPPSADEG
ncbi:redoxin domain-containing protein [Zavarzinella formosa]|uniref:redoxin domain-containing protein n=1 Tax=Zavarzinella formosa TaxID=360055 RepID=UPI0003632851|nr:redoxin domain-containing protein [Zavarzinella formosa]